MEFQFQPNKKLVLRDTIGLQPSSCNFALTDRSELRDTIGLEADGISRLFHTLEGY